MTPDRELKIPGECYLVGGAVRDQLLGLPIADRDWVVVGASAEAMLEAGFLKVGSAFPVFLHPITHEQYALARKEYKVSPGHRGFETESGPDISLLEDLQRRDLTINAIAKDRHDNLIDPTNGSQDIKDKVLRHVSDSFKEDPLRSYRVARFAASLVDFSVHKTTLELMESMASELQELSAERVWNEWFKAMNAASPGRFYEVIKEAKVDSPWFSMLDLEAIIRRHKQYPHSFSGALGVIAQEHEYPVCEGFLTKLKAPRKTSQLVNAIHAHGAKLANFEELTSTEALDTLEATQALRNTQFFDDLLLVMTELGHLNEAVITQVVDAIREVRGSTQQGIQAGEDIKQRRLKVIQEILGN